MIVDAKRKVLIYLGLALVMIVLIASGLPRLQLNPGLPLPRLQNDEWFVIPDAAGSEPVAEIRVNTFIEILFFTVIGLFVLNMIFKLIKGISWKEVLPALLAYSLFTLAVIFLLYFLLKGLSTSQPTPLPELPPPSVPLPASPLGSPPPLLNWLVAISLAVTAALISVWLIRRGAKTELELTRLGLAAVKARQGILTGLDLKRVILECYRQMSMALQQEQGIEREAFMTTREFERLLEDSGVPHDPVHELTQLFEAVRYGRWQPNPGDEQKAIRCLDAIIHYSRVAKQTGFGENAIGDQRPGTGD